MKILAFILAAAMVCPSNAADELIATNGRDSVWISNQPCASAFILTHFPPDMHKLLKSAHAYIDGVTHASVCWVLVRDTAHILYEDGDKGEIPITDFHLDRNGI